jgi:hypothetical protein
MPRVTEATSWDAAQPYSHLFSEGYETGGKAANGFDFAAMFLDSLGTVRYCHADAARLFRAGAQTLVGRHVSALIPDLPFHSMTPGYNVAYATFWAPKGLQRGFCGVDNNGRAFGLQIEMDRLELEKQHLILLRLLLPVGSARLLEPYAGQGRGVGAQVHRAEIPVVTK